MASGEMEMVEAVDWGLFKLKPLRLFKELSDHFWHRSAVYRLSRRVFILCVGQFVACD